MVLLLCSSFVEVTNSEKLYKYIRERREKKGSSPFVLNFRQISPTSTLLFVIRVFFGAAIAAIPSGETFGMRERPVQLNVATLLGDCRRQGIWGSPSP